MIMLFEASKRNTREVQPGTVDPFSHNTKDNPPKKLIEILAKNPSLTINLRGRSENSVKEFIARPNIFESVYFELPAKRGCLVVGI